MWFSTIVDTPLTYVKKKHTLRLFIRGKVHGHPHQAADRCTPVKMNAVFSAVASVREFLKGLLFHHQKIFYCV